MSHVQKIYINLLNAYAFVVRVRVPIFLTFVLLVGWVCVVSFVHPVSVPTLSHVPNSDATSKCEFGSKRQTS